MQIFLLSYDQQCPGIKRRWLIVAGLEIFFVSLAFHPTCKMKWVEPGIAIVHLVQLPLWEWEVVEVQLFSIKGTDTM